MDVVATITTMRAKRRGITASVGFIPTMGSLHNGHLALVKEAKRNDDIVIVSIFLNRPQFDSQQDFARYPRDFKRDLELLEREKVDFVFTPSCAEIYPSEFATWVEVKKISERLEGRERPGHFRGVATIVTKLFNIVQPTRIYFGQKDAQQAMVISKMITDLNIDVEMITVPTVREADGLAMSSRNSLLSKEERQAASIIYRALTVARQMHNRGVVDSAKIRCAMISCLEKEPLVTIEYVDIAASDTLDELPVIDRAALVSLAAKIGKVRLIDNLLLYPPK
ncbi:pantoate--beta-alanine ligase [Candidatus Bipolaricaulota bacterium]|nr:pantoate--beta-alanine ligase [Candidatus Bipolaricaulota bacterium]